jgi:hypothetical protein
MKSDEIAVGVVAEPTYDLHSHQVQAGTRGLHSFLESEVL